MSTSIAKTQRYLPHTLETRFHAVKTYRSGFSVKFVVRRYKISKASLMRWNRRFDGTIDSLRDRSHRPKTPHPNAHTPQEKTWIKNLIRRNPTISLIELYAKLKFQRGYQRHPCSLFRFLRKQGFYKEKPTKKKIYVPKPYDTPKRLGIKWQLDVKYVPKACYVGRMPDKFYQYTVIDEASRERFIYAFREQSSYSSVEFIKMAIKHFGYRPKIIQTDNGFEFTHFRETQRTHPFDLYCQEQGIVHQLIRPRVAYRRFSLPFLVSHHLQMYISKKSGKAIKIMADINLDRLIVPIYINEKIVLDMLAIMEDGFSMVSQINYTEHKENHSAQKANAAVTTSDTILSKLLRINISGELSHDGNKDEKESVVKEKVHTNVSLLSKFRGFLLEHKMLNSDFNFSKMQVGDFIEVEGELQKNLLINYMDIFIDLFHMVEIFIEKPQLGNKKQANNQK